MLQRAEEGVGDSLSLYGMMSGVYSNSSNSEQCAPLANPLNECMSQDFQ